MKFGSFCIWWFLDLYKLTATKLGGFTCNKIVSVYMLRQKLHIYAVCVQQVLLIPCRALCSLNILIDVSNGFSLHYNENLAMCYHD